MCRGPNPNLLILQLSVHFIPRHALHQLPSMMQCWFTQSLRTPRIHHCYMYRFHITQFHPYAILCNTIISSYFRVSVSLLSHTRLHREAIVKQLLSVCLHPRIGAHCVCTCQPCMKRPMSGGSQPYAHCKGQLLVVTVSVLFLLLKKAVSGIPKVNMSLRMIA